MALLVAPAIPMKTAFSISGMHCGACADKVGGALRRAPGIRGAVVTLSPPRAEVESDSPPDAAALAEAVSRAGDYSLTTLNKAQSSSHDAYAETPVEPKPSLYPLILIVLYLLGAVLLGDWARGRLSVRSFMNDFMAGFFLVFSFFKLLDIRGFADAYRRYDLLAKAWKPWALLYPFVELALGVAFLLEWRPTITNGFTLVLMLIGAAGVCRALLRKDEIRCACLGTALNLPMTTVTLVEDVGMAAMAGAMLAWTI
jgi:copper chaperone CopZ